MKLPWWLDRFRDGGLITAQEPEDDLEREFRELEVEVRQRECPHELVFNVGTMEAPFQRLCPACGKRWL